MRIFAKNLGRRSVLKGMGITGAALTTPTIIPSGVLAASYTNEPKGPSVTFGFNVPQTGAYTNEGADELRGYALAVEHINAGGGGMLDTFSSKALARGGINGKRVEYVTGDTQTKSDIARVSARRMLETAGAVMISGGSSSGVAVAVQDLCHEAGVLFLAGLSHSNSTTGIRRRANGFRHFFNAEMTAATLAPALEKAFGRDRTAYHLTADYPWGRSQESAIRRHTAALNWQTLPPARMPLGAADALPYITAILESDADVLVFNHYGPETRVFLEQAIRMGLRDKQRNGKELAIVVPLLTRQMTQSAGTVFQGVVGSTNWHWSLADAGSKAFVRAFEEKYDFPTSQAAHTANCQAILYADAAQRAGTFRPSGVGAALEGFTFDGLGNGPTEYRADDHQCFKDGLVVQRKTDPVSPFDTLAIIDRTPRNQIEYPSTQLGGALGPYNDGA